MNFQDIFSEYYPLFRGQATNIPAYPDREYQMAVALGNNAIRKWDRVDGELWNELVTRAQDQSITILPVVAKTIAASTVSYPAPTNMRKPPKEIWVFKNGQYNRLSVLESKNISGLSELNTAVTFLGSANTGYTMLISQKTSEDYDGWQVDYLYYRKPTMLPTTSDPSAIIVDMSDPNFMIQTMLAGRYANAKNGFGFNTASAAAKEALIGMKIENSSGVPGRSDSFNLEGGWGVNSLISTDMEL